MLEKSSTSREPTCIGYIKYSSLQKLLGFRVASLLLQGMYRTAVGIRDKLLDPGKPILTNTLHDYEKDVRT